MNPIKASPHYTLSSLMEMVENTIKNAFKNDVYWVKAEIATFSVAPSGYGRFEFVEKDPNNAQSLATVKGLCWKRSLSLIRNHFIDVTGSDIQANIKILFQASITFDRKYGLTLDIKDIDPAYTLGEVERAKQLVIKKLKDDGDFYLNKSLPKPALFQRIALISASDSKGREDFEQVLKSNPYGYTFICHLYEAKLAGETAAVDIRKRIIQIYKKMFLYDAIVIVRGGGASMECFNEYNLSKAIARVPIPVLTGIGHTSNKSIADEVAFKSFITPTEVGNYIVEQMVDYESIVLQLQSEITLKSSQMLSLFQSKLIGIKSRIEISSLKTLNSNIDFVSKLKFKIEMETDRRVKKEKSFNENQIFILKNKTEQLLSIKRNSIHLFEEKVNLLDPENILKRGFSITRLNNKYIHKGTSLQIGDEIETQILEGKIYSKITEMVKSK